MVDIKRLVQFNAQLLDLKALNIKKKKLFLYLIRNVFFYKNDMGIQIVKD